MAIPVGAPDRPMPWSGLIRPGRVHGSLYTDPAIFQLEPERIWYGGRGAKEDLGLAHVARIDSYRGSGSAPPRSAWPTTSRACGPRTRALLIRQAARDLDRRPP